MSIYSSSFDPRHFEDENANIVAFLEFIVAHLISEPIVIDGGSLFDCMPLHNIWSNFYPYLLEYSDRYRTYKCLPLQIVIEKKERIVLDNVPGQIAQSYILGNIGKFRDIKASDFCFNVIDLEDQNRARHGKLSYQLSQGNFDCLSQIQNAVFHKSIRYLNEYCNRFRPFGLRSYAIEGESMDFYVLPITRFANKIQDIYPELVAEILSGARELSNAPLFLRQSTATLINEARLLMPMSFDKVVTPICRALRSRERAAFLATDIHINYELSALEDTFPDLYILASLLVSEHARVDSANILYRKQIALTDPLYEGKISQTFDWGGFIDRVLTSSYQLLVKKYKSSKDIRERIDNLYKCIDHIYQDLFQLISIELDSKEEDKIYLKIKMKNKNTNVYIVRIPSKLSKKPQSGLDDSFYIDYINADKTKGALQAICTMRGTL